ncbi:hypothetical protein L1987_06108 [Smallanthus sonchifolius]|uniref:Uncharacterized protein n=1 Tax=Smallanthus sonchifolius TaxID=185202 RepID=A0ACB9JXC8_9ASTR|nr:hypothetical protein L1987_06108 [Smallanthus sonchifolius]
MDPRMQKQSTEIGGRNTSMMTKPHGDADFWPLSGKPYFYVVISNSKRFQLNIPLELSEKLPTTTVNAKIIYREKVWDLLYLGDQVTKRFGVDLWGKFMTENNLAVGDACLFELMEGSSNSRVVMFKVQIFRDDFPVELLEKVEGFCTNNPIDLD